MIIRRRRNSAFTIVPNAVLADGRLSIEARWLVAWFLSKPTGCIVSIDTVRAAAGVGQGKAYRMVNEARAAGYLERANIRNPDGTFHGYRYTLEEQGNAS
jgi:hypothetical protein